MCPPSPGDDIPVCQHTDTPDGQAGVVDCLYTLSIPPHAHGSILSTAHKVQPIGQHGYTVHEVLVAVVDGQTLSRDKPAADGGIIGTRKELAALGHCQTAHAVFMTYHGNTYWLQTAVRHSKIFVSFKIY